VGVGVRKIQAEVTPNNNIITTLFLLARASPMLACPSMFEISLPARQAG